MKGSLKELKNHIKVGTLIRTPRGESTFEYLDRCGDAGCEVTNVDGDYFMLKGSTRWWIFAYGDYVEIIDTTINLKTMDIKNNQLTIGGKTTTLSPKQLKELGLRNGWKNRVAKDTEYYFLDETNDAVPQTEDYDDYDNQLYDSGNYFLTQAECHAEKMRIESARARWTYIPQDPEPFWYWSFEDAKAIRDIYITYFTSEWNIGAVHRTKEECEAWGAKYSAYFKLPV